MKLKMISPQFALRSAAPLDQLQAHVQSLLIGRVRNFCLIIKEQGLILRGSCPARTGRIAEVGFAQEKEVEDEDSNRWNRVGGGNLDLPKALRR